MSLAVVRVRVSVRVDEPSVVSVRVVEPWVVSVDAVRRLATAG